MKRTLITLCVAALLVTAGCSGLADDPSGEDGNSDVHQTAQTQQNNDLGKTTQIQQTAIEAMQDVDTYRMTMVMEFSAKGQTITRKRRSVVNREAKKVRIVRSFLGIQTATYIDGTTMYVKMRGHWRTRNISKDNWKEGIGLAILKDLLASANASVVGSATVDGTATTVPVVEPTEAALQRLFSPPQNRSYESVENVTYRMDTAKETHRLRKIEITMTMRTNSQTVTVEITMTYAAYNEPVNITIPEAATAGPDHAASATAPSAHSTSAHPATASRVG